MTPPPFPEEGGSTQVASHPWIRELPEGSAALIYLPHIYMPLEAWLAAKAFGFSVASLQQTTFKSKVEIWRHQTFNRRGWCSSSAVSPEGIS